MSPGTKPDRPWRWSAAFAALLLLTLVPAGCRKPAEPDASPPPPAGPPAREAALDPAPAAAAAPEPIRADAKAPEPAGKTRLEVKWPVGARYVYRLELEQHSTNALPQAPRTTQEDLALGVTYALQVRNEGDSPARRVEVEFLAFDIDVKVNGAPAMRFESHPSDGAASPNALSQPFAKVVGSKVGLILGPDGGLREVKGLDEWTRRVVGDGAEPAEQMLAQQFNEGFFRQMVEFGKGLPPGAVGPGDAWPYHVETPAGALGKMILDSAIKFRGWEVHDDRRLVVIDARGALRSETQQDPQTPGALSVENGSLTSASWFDPQSGVLVESTVDQQMRLAGRAADPVGAASSPGQFTCDLAQRVTVKLVDAGASDP